MVNTSQSIVTQNKDDYQFISVIVPVYNEHCDLAVCLQSLKNQNYPHNKFEVIAVDDGSTDKSPSIASDFGAKVLYQKHRGPAAARNRGTKEASGSLIAFIDADDKAHENWLQEVAPYFHDDRVDAVGCNHSLLNKNNDFVKITWLERNFRIVRSPEKVNHLGTSGCLYKKSTFNSVGGFDGNLIAAEDMDLASRVNKQGGTLYLIKKPLIEVRYPNSWMQYFRDQIKKSAYIILFRWKSKETSGKLGNSYSGLTDYVQSLFLYVFLFGLFFQNVNFLLAITTVLFLSLLVLNISFISFVSKNGSKLELGPFFPITLIFYLVIRDLSWSFGLIYGGILILKNNKYFN